MSLFGPPFAWFLAGARTVSLNAPAEVPLELVPNDPRPTIAATIEQRPTLVRIDVGGWSRVGRIAAIRLGLDVKGDRTTFDLEVGPLSIKRMRAEVVDGEEVVLGLAAMPQVRTTVSASRGLLLMQRPSDAEPLTDPIEMTTKDGRRALTASGVTYRIDTATRQSQGPNAGSMRRGHRGATTLVPIQSQPVSLWIQHADVAVLAADALSSFDIQCDGDECSFTPATAWTHNPARIDLRLEVAAARARTRAADDDDPVAPTTSIPAGNPGSSWRADRWLKLADAHWAAGQLTDAIEVGQKAVWAGGDRCEPWMIWGERQLRAGHADAAREAVVHADSQLTAWESKVSGYTLHQPESCRRAAALADEARLAGQIFPTHGVGQAVLALQQGDPARASRRIRADLLEHPNLDARRLGLLALADAQLGRSLPATAGLKALAAHPDADTLSAAVLGAHIAATLSPIDNGRALLDSAPSPVWQTLAAFIAGEQPTTELPLARRPADPALWAAARLQGLTAPTLVAPSADAVWARLLLAHQRQDLDAVYDAWTELQERWPLEVWAGIVSRTPFSTDGFNDSRSEP